MAAILAGCNAVDMEERVNELYEKMSQEERIAQLRSGYMNEFFDKNGVLDTAKCRKEIANGIGHFSQYASQAPTDPNVLRDHVAAMQEWLMNNKCSRVSTPAGPPSIPSR